MTVASSRTGGRILVDQLVVQGVARVYCVPGESFLAALDALHDSPIEVMVCRQEGGAAMMALTEGRLTERPGICFVTRGPGATNAAHGVHIAEHDSAPMILFVGQVERAMLGRGAFQEMDYRSFFGSTAKWVAQVETAAQIPEVVHRAFHIAIQGRPGPVVIALPEDMLFETADPGDPDLAWSQPDGPVAKTSLERRATDCDPWRSRLDRARERRIRSFRAAFRLACGRLVPPRKRLRWRA
jgi:acetolactate synthase-1/2/3 large subunit